MRKLTLEELHNFPKSYSYQVVEPGFETMNTAVRDYTFNNSVI